MTKISGAKIHIKVALNIKMPGSIPGTFIYERSPNEEEITNFY